MKWQTKALIQGTLSLLPFGGDLHLLLQKRFGGLRSFDPEASLLPVIKRFIAPLQGHFGRVEGLSVLEVGTGWIPTLPIALGLLGARCRTYDVARHLDARHAEKTLRGVAPILDRGLQQEGVAARVRPPRLERLGPDSTLDDVLGLVRVHYEAPVDTLRLPVAAGSQDAVVSNLVLQHVPPRALPRLLSELHRALRPGGIALHRVNLHDELASVDPEASPIHFLKHPDWLWERFGNNAIKYVNRARYPAYLRAFEGAGFEVRRVETRVDPRAVESLQTMKVAERFRECTVEELATVALWVCLQKPCPRSAEHGEPESGRGASGSDAASRKAEPASAS
jgi:SAM-dependent methyltransferase